MWHSLLCFLCFNLPRAQMEYITDHALSIAAMKSLVEMESLFIKQLDGYSDDLERKINTIESFLDEVQRKRDPWKHTPDEFVAHPLTSFSLIRRLHEDWSYMEIYMSERVGLDSLNTIQRILDAAKPTEQDLHDAISGIDAIQNYYDLKPTDIANGLLNGRQYNTNLTTLECLAMAKVIHESNQPNKIHSTIEWYQAALQRYDEARDGHLYREVFNFKLSELYDRYARSLASIGSGKAALTLLQNVSDLHADLWLLRRLLKNQLDLFERHDTYIKNDPDTESLSCLGLLPAVGNLSCHYEATGTAFLRLAPLKVEMLSLDPYIALYHDAIYNTEISRVMTLALSSLIGPGRYSERREHNLKSATVYEDANSQLNQRTRDMAGDKDNDFRIYNTGIGGYIRYHVDNLAKEDHQPGLGDYQTTIMFFLNEVPHGGAISFPKLHFTVPPRKGSALVWHNLNSNMEPDLRVAHISCPVIVGSKWTLIKWLHEEN